jgi:hypothetical protein
MMGLTILVQARVVLACHYCLCQKLVGCCVEHICESVCTMRDGLQYVNEADIVHSAIVANGDCFVYTWSTISTHPLSQLGDGALARSVLGELDMCK